jgi:hypothetical protein
MICPTCQTLHFDGAFQRCEDCRYVEDMEDALTFQWNTPLVRRALASSMSGYIRDQLSKQSLARTFLPVQQVPTKKE